MLISREQEPPGWGGMSELVISVEIVVGFGVARFRLLKDLYA